VLALLAIKIVTKIKMDEEFLNEPAEADFHEVSSQSDEEDESLFEIHDFSTASDWEKCIQTHIDLTSIDS
jgi:hypothetical protein